MSTRGGAVVCVCVADMCCCCCWCCDWCCWQVWEDPDAFKPERFPLDQPVPTEQNTDYRWGKGGAGGAEG